MANFKDGQIGQTPRSRSKGKTCWYPQKDLATRNTHAKYQSSDSLFKSFWQC